MTNATKVRCAAALLRARYWLAQKEGRWALNFSAMAFLIIAVSVTVIALWLRQDEADKPWGGALAICLILGGLSAMSIACARIAWSLTRGVAGATSKKLEIEERIARMQGNALAQKEGQELREAIAREGEKINQGSIQKGRKNPARRL